MNYSIGLDIGGTKVAAGIISNQGKIIKQTEVKSDTTNRETMYASVKNALQELERDSDFSWNEIYGMGIGVPGKVDREKGVAIFQSNLPWEHFPVKQRIMTDFPIKRIVIDNDVYMAAFAEWEKIAIPEQQLMSYITISTGISSAQIQNGRFLRGAGFAGELGQIPVFLDKYSTLEQAVAGPGIEILAQKKLNDSSLTTKSFFQKYLANESNAVVLMQDIVSVLARGIYTLVTLYDPHVIVFGGSVATNNPFLIELIKEEMKVWLLEDQKHILNHTKLSHYSHLSGLVGAGLRAFKSLD